MIADQGRIYDGYASLEGGVDGGRRPNLIAPNQCEEARNVVFRGGAPTNRPAFKELTLTFDNPNLTYNSTGLYLGQDVVANQSISRFKNGLFQEASYYAPSRGREYLMATIAGRMFQITPGLTSANVHEVALPPRRNRSTIPIAYHCQADKYHITQDGESTPIIFDGVTARRAGKDEIFVGTIMAYGMNRIVLKGLSGEIFFGDIRDGTGNGGADVLRFTETQFLNEGFATAIPSSMGEPNAIAFIPQQDTATGVGECLVFGQNGVESFFLSIPREQWKDSVFQRTALLGIGATGHRQVAVVNQDIWFRASDGYRSYRQARAQVNEWAQLSKSSNVRKWANNDTPALLGYGSMIEFGTRLIATCTPEPNQGRLFHFGALSLDFDVLSTFGNTTSPAWDGHWEDFNLSSKGLRILQLVEGKFNGRQRAFAFALLYHPTTPQTILMELEREPKSRDTGGTITSQVTMRSMDFEEPYNEKYVYGADVFIDNIAEPLSGTVDYRPDQIPKFQPWDTFSGTTVGVAQTIKFGVPQATVGYAPRTTVPKPNETADKNTSRMFRRGYEIQPRLTWKGRATMRRFRVHAQRELEDSKAKGKGI